MRTPNSLLTVLNRNFVFLEWDLRVVLSPKKNHKWNNSFNIFWKQIKTMYSGMSKTCFIFQLINISYTRLSQLNPNIFKDLPHLKTVDLRRNQLEYYNGSLTIPNKFFRLFLSGKTIKWLNSLENNFSMNLIFFSENPFDCSRNFEWLIPYAKTKYIIDRESLQCSDNSFKNQSIVTVMKTKTVYQYSCNVIPSVMKTKLWLQSLRRICHNNLELRNCTCNLSYIALGLDGVFRPMYSINCSSLELNHLPKSLPENTTTFYAQHNNVILFVDPKKFVIGIWISMVLRITSVRI